MSRPHRRGELGYWIGVPFWNRGYATEAAMRVVQFALDVCGLHRVQAMCLPTNVGSVRVLEKIGMRHEGTMRWYVQKWGTMEDRSVYGLIRPEWESHRAGSSSGTTTAPIGSP